MSLAAEVWSGTHRPRTLPRLLFGFQWWPWGNRPLSRISPFLVGSTGPQVGRRMRSNFLPCCADIFNRSCWRSLVGSKLQRHDVVSTGLGSKFRIQIWPWPCSVLTQTLYKTFSHSAAISDEGPTPISKEDSTYLETIQQSSGDKWHPVFEVFVDS